MEPAKVTQYPSISNAPSSAVVRGLLEEREERLSPYAVRSRDSKGRDALEQPSRLRTEFQRDRDRILHSNAFRRLKHKTQVFVAPQGDHYVTRLTHTLEVSQIARTIARALNLNEDLTEAIALGHDLGHTPFGHIGEDVLNELCAGGFAHSSQSLRIVERLEKDGAGLNLTWEVRQGIERHSKPRGDFLSEGLRSDLSLEAQICRISDAVAYLNHDLVDAYRAGVLAVEDLPTEASEVLGESHSERIDTLVCDIVESSWDATGWRKGAEPSSPSICMSAPVREAFVVLREFMFRSVYLPVDEHPEGRAARRIVRTLYEHFCRNPEAVPAGYAARAAGDRAAVDYLAGMTDRYAMRAAESIEPGIADVFRSRLL